MKGRGRDTPSWATQALDDEIDRISAVLGGSRSERDSGVSRRLPMEVG